MRQPLRIARDQFAGATERASIALDALESVLAVNGYTERPIQRAHTALRQVWDYYQRLELATTTNEDAYERALDHADRAYGRLHSRAYAIPELATYVEVETE